MLQQLCNPLDLRCRLDLLSMRAPVRKAGMLICQAPRGEPRLPLYTAEELCFLFLGFDSDSQCTNLGGNIREADSPVLQIGWRLRWHRRRGRGGSCAGVRRMRTSAAAGQPERRRGRLWGAHGPATPAESHQLPDCTGKFSLCSPCSPPRLTSITYWHPPQLLVGVLTNNTVSLQTKCWHPQGWPGKLSSREDTDNSRCQAEICTLLPFWA